MSITKYFRGLFALAAIVLAFTASAFAQPGGRMICNANTENGGGCATSPGLLSTINWPGFPTFTLNSTGTSNFTILAQGIAPPSFTTMPASFSASGFDPMTGPFTWSYNGAPVPNSFAIFNTLGFWDSDIFITISGTFGFMPGRTFQSMGVLHFRSRAPGLTAFNPHVCGVYDLVVPTTGIGFEDAAAPGVAVFTLNAIRLTLNN